VQWCDARAAARDPEVKLVQQSGFVFRSSDRAKADIILAVDGKAVRTRDDLLTIAASKRPGEHIELTILRGGRRQAVEVEPAESRHRRPSQSTTVGPISEPSDPRE
jgi:S1-C subfamily serine protease